MYQSRQISIGRLHLEPYWLLIAALLIAGGILYGFHLASGETPDRVLIRIEPFSFDIYWYGIIIMGGIALGTYVTGTLAAVRANRAFIASVPAPVSEISIDELALDDDITIQVRKRGLETVGQLLFQLGLESNDIGLNDRQLLQIEQALDARGDIDRSWIDDPPWRQWQPDHAWVGITWSLVLAVVGARLYHVLTPSPSLAAVGIESAADYLRNPMQLINLRNGGLGIYGGLAGGALGLFLYARRHQLPYVAWADISVVGLALGQAVGRWGNFFNQELYGGPTNLPWALHVDELHRLRAYSNAARFHPAFLYASLWSLLTFTILIYLIKRHPKKLFTGDLTALYLEFYASGRILLELVRLDSRTTSLGPLSIDLPVATIISLIVGLFAAGVILWRHRRSLPNIL